MPTVYIPGNRGGYAVKRDIPQSDPVRDWRRITDHRGNTIGYFKDPDAIHDLAGSGVIGTDDWESSYKLSIGNIDSIHISTGSPAISYQISATGGTDPKNYAVSAKALPAGWVLDPLTGIIAIPANLTSLPTSFTGLQISVTDSSGTTAVSNPFNIEVGNPVVFSGTIADITELQRIAINIDISSNFSNSPTSYKLVGAPSWLTIASNGVISGQGSRDQLVTGITVEAKNSFGTKAISNPFNLEITLAAPIFAAGPIPDMIVVVNTNIDKDIEKYFRTGGKPTSYTLDPAVSGLSINSAGRMIGTIGTIGIITITKITATNSGGSADSGTFDITVTDANIALINSATGALLTGTVPTSVLTP